MCNPKKIKSPSTNENISNIGSYFLAYVDRKMNEESVRKNSIQREKDNQTIKIDADLSNPLKKDALRKKAERKVDSGIPTNSWKRFKLPTIKLPENSKKNNNDVQNVFPTKFNRITPKIEKIDKIKLKREVVPMMMNGLVKRGIVNLQPMELSENEDPKTRADRQKKYNARPDQIKKRSARVMARREMERRGLVHKGDGKDIDHKDGNPKNNSKSNLRVMSRHKNRGRNNNKGNNIDESKYVYLPIVDSSKREIGTDSLKKLYKWLTPGQQDD